MARGLSRPKSKQRSKHWLRALWLASFVSIHRRSTVNQSERVHLTRCCLLGTVLLHFSVIDRLSANCRTAARSRRATAHFWYPIRLLGAFPIGMARRIIASILLLLVVGSCHSILAHAKYICDPSSAGGQSFPYCVSIPDKMPADNCGGKLPLVLYLGGSGTKGEGNDVVNHVSGGPVSQVLHTSEITVDLGGCGASSS